MTSEPLELEGTWEEIVAYSDDLAGRRVRVIVLSDESASLSSAPKKSKAFQAFLDSLEERKEVYRRLASS